MVEIITPLEKVKSRKKPHSKVRTGCLTCKIRRVKCDETKPVCIRCSSFGRKCDGYAQWKPKELEIKNPATTTISTTVPTPRESTLPSSRSPLPLSLSQFAGSPEEISSFQYFCEKTVPLLDAVSLVPFFRESVLLLSDNNDIIKSLVLAISCTHQSISRPTQDVAKQRALFFAHYNKALRHMIGATNPNIGVVVTACTMFAACDDICGRGHSALRHIAAAFAIVHTYQMKDQSEKDKASDEIIETYVGPLLELCRRRAVLFKGDDIGGVPEGPSKITLPDAFSNSEEAMQVLNNLISRYLGRYTDPWSIPDRVIDIDGLDDQKDLETAFLQWGHMVNEYLLANSDNFDFIFKARGSLLRIHGSILSVMVKTAFQPDEMEWDRYDIWRGMAQNLQPIVEGYIELVRCDQHQDIDDERDFGIIPPLFLVAIRCREPQTRRLALQQLYRLRRAEGSWSSFAAAKIAETIINIEERGLAIVRDPQDVPKENRIRALDVHWEESPGSMPLTKIIRSSGYQGLIQSRPMLKMSSP
ncbi:putative transcription factor cys6 [Phaeomoniella chlamydospora]|uniref:Putative transcription factor cys6 n=1 Tax=Phaeomoniella chlamydospora TaxID=158046 RepID=A0A0G2EM07_PHACM|nr:putative transcription factor cys6 [Phaeomoniella chlamydospora]